MQPSCDRPVQHQRSILWTASNSSFTEIMSQPGFIICAFKAFTRASAARVSAPVIFLGVIPEVTALGVPEVTALDAVKDVGTGVDIAPVLCPYNPLCLSFCWALDGVAFGFCRGVGGAGDLTVILTGDWLGGNVGRRAGIVMLPTTMCTESGVGGEAGTGGVDDGGDHPTVLEPAVVDSAMFAADVMSPSIMSAFVARQLTDSVGGATRQWQIIGEDSCSDSIECSMENSRD